MEPKWQQPWHSARRRRCSLPSPLCCSSLTAHLHFHLPSSPSSPPPPNPSPTTPPAPYVCRVCKASPACSTDAADRPPSTSPFSPPSPPYPYSVWWHTRLAGKTSVMPIADITRWRSFGRRAAKSEPEPGAPAWDFLGVATAVGVLDDMQDREKKGADEGFECSTVVRCSMQSVIALIVNLSRQGAYAKL